VRVKRTHHHHTAHKGHHKGKKKAKAPSKAAERVLLAQGQTSMSQSNTQFAELVRQVSSALLSAGWMASVVDAIEQVIESKMASAAGNLIPGVISNLAGGVQPAGGGAPTLVMVFLNGSTLAQPVYVPPQLVADVAAGQEVWVRAANGNRQDLILDSIRNFTSNNRLNTDGGLVTTPSTGTPLAMTATNAGIEIGNPNVGNTPFVDFHSSGGPARDFDARVIASGGNAGVNGQATLQIIAGLLSVLAQIQTNVNVMVNPSGVGGGTPTMLDVNPSGATVNKRWAFPLYNGANGHAQIFNITDGVNNMDFSPNGDLTIAGALTALGAILTGALNFSAALQNTINGTTSGTIVWSMPFRGAAFKVVVMHLAGYRNASASPQNFVLPTDFTTSAIVATMHSTVGGTGFIFRDAGAAIIQANQVVLGSAGAGGSASTNNNVFAFSLQSVNGAIHSVDSPINNTQVGTGPVFIVGF
jgi:hypothetical protein